MWLESQKTTFRTCGRSIDNRTRVAYNPLMPEPIARDGIIDALREMPPDATIDDVIERLVFVVKIEAGLSELDTGKGIPYDEARHRLGL
jgi:hypothetical protein